MLFRLLLSIILTLLVSMPQESYAEAPEPERFSNLRLELDNLDPAWWEGFQESTPAEKQQFFAALARQYQRLFTNTLAENTEAKLILELTKNLATASSRALDEPLRPEVKARYSVNDWLDILRNYHTLIQAQSELKQSLQELDITIPAHKKEIANLLLKYRGLSRQSTEKIPLALGVIRRQLELLIASAQKAHAQMQYSLVSEALSYTKQVADSAVLQLETSEQTISEQQARVDDLRTQLEALSTAYAQNRIHQLQQASPAEALDTKIDSLRLDATITQTRVSLASTELLQSILSISMAKPQESQPLNGSRLNDISSRIGVIRTALNKAQETTLSAPSMTDKQRYQAISELQKIRMLLDDSTTRLQEARLLSTYAEQLYRTQQSFWDRVVSGGQQVWAHSGSLLLKWVNYPLFSINQAPVSLIDILWMFIIITAAAFISRQFKHLLMRIGASQRTFSDAAVFTISKIIHYIIMVVAIIIGLSSIGLDLSNVALIAGALSLGIGFGLQSIFNNFISGLILLFERPFRMGDLVELESGVRGRIRSINVRSTHINTWDNVDILVPNSEFIGGRVTNYTLADDIRRLHIPFGVAYGSDKEIVRKAALEAADQVAYTLKAPQQEPKVWLVNFGDSSLDFELIVWIHHNKLPAGHDPSTDYLWALETSLANNQIEIPFPQRDLHFRSMDNKIIATMNTSKTPATRDINT